ncbi:MAG: trk/ktr system potassium uptake protein [Thermoanaerobacteraceae bacterium]|jgi:trk system potassium uptake protein TrkA|nr:trk/ktr system potassium uptake protein [Thermoanaerobacteraceae bacterium]MDN5312453.1 trk/ktr system potassium uptake protein [Thermoanaerobacteraceae bacterium]
MKQLRQFAVIGMGRFGTSIASTLLSLGHEVLAIDKDENRIREISAKATHAVIADATNENALRSLGLDSFDCVIVSIGCDIQASILTTLILKDIGVKKIIAKAASDLHGKVLSKTGATTVIYPERDMAEKLAKSLASLNVLNMVEIARDACLIEINTPKIMVGKTLKELNLSQKYKINVVALKRKNDVKVILPPDEVLLEDDTLLVIGPGSCLKWLGEIA